jgi:hypothetical protein
MELDLSSAAVRQRWRIGSVTLFAYREQTPASRILSRSGVPIPKTQWVIVQREDNRTIRRRSLPTYESYQTLIQLNVIANVRTDLGIDEKTAAEAIRAVLDVARRRGYPRVDVNIETGELWVSDDRERTEVWRGSGTNRAAQK